MDFQLNFATFWALLDPSVPTAFSGLGIYNLVDISQLVSLSSMQSTMKELQDEIIIGCSSNLPQEFTACSQRI